MQEIQYVKINEEHVDNIVEVFGDYLIKHKCLHFEEGSQTIVAYDKEVPIGLISTYPKSLTKPLENIKEAYIDVIEVRKEYRRHGIATALIQRMEEWAKDYGYPQIRAWSNDKKVEAIPMWNRLNYCMCPTKIYVEWCKEVVDGYYVIKRFS